MMDLVSPNRRLRKKGSFTPSPQCRGPKPKQKTSPRRRLPSSENCHPNHSSPQHKHHIHTKKPSNDNTLPSQAMSTVLSCKSNNNPLIKPELGMHSYLSSLDSDEETHSSEEVIMSTVLSCKSNENPLIKPELGMHSYLSLLDSNEETYSIRESVDWEGETGEGITKNYNDDSTDLSSEVMSKKSLIKPELGMHSYLFSSGSNEERHVGEEEVDWEEEQEGGNWKLNPVREILEGMSPFREGRVRILIKAFESLMSKRHPISMEGNQNKLKLQGIFTQKEEEEEGEKLVVGSDENCAYSSNSNVSEKKGSLKSEFIDASTPSKSISSQLEEEGENSVLGSDENWPHSANKNVLENKGFQKSNFIDISMPSKSTIPEGFTTKTPLQKQPKIAKRMAGIDSTKVARTPMQGTRIDARTDEDGNIATNEPLVVASVYYDSSGRHEANNMVNSSTEENKEMKPNNGSVDTQPDLATIAAEIMQGSKDGYKRHLGGELDSTCDRKRYDSNDLVSYSDEGSTGTEDTSHEEGGHRSFLKGGSFSKPQPFKLHTKVLPKPLKSTKYSGIPSIYRAKAVERAEFNQYIAEKLRCLEQQRFEEERLQKIVEEEEIKRMRKEMVPRAQMMPKFDRPFKPKRSSYSKVFKESHSSKGAKFPSSTKKMNRVCCC